jgi:hypothetical protein
MSATLLSRRRGVDGGNLGGVDRFLPLTEAAYRNDLGNAKDVIPGCPPGDLGKNAAPWLCPNRQLR